ncbi:MAG: tetratricopeptide (TPR) repeat protein [Saprospiraceae bacterium]|jgi:tetratricopeptide (TPR) repeat protein
MKKYISILVILTFAVSSVLGQTKKAFLKAADEAYAQKNFYGALKWYSEALEFEEDDPELIYKVAESARNFEAYDLAAEKYKIVADSLGEDKYPAAAYHLGEMYYRLGKYDDAKQYYNLYLSEYSSTDSLKTISANKELKSIEFALSRMEDIDKSADLIQMESEVNTPYSEFGAIKKDEILYFTTMRYVEKDSPEFPARSISKIHTIEEEENIDIQGDLNDSNFLIAHTTFSSDGTVLYYTICEYINSEDVRCDIYSRFRNDDGTFGEKKKLPSPINIDSVTNTQPQVSFDSTLMKDVLYFVSDREGGEGKLDIYRAILGDNDSYNAPENMTEFNTSGNDVTPFYHTTTGTMYFSSDAREGLGGYDVYFSERSKNGYLEPIHMRIPINSSYHDLYYVLDATSEEGYFSTNREGTMYLDPTQKACCFDIYKVEYDEVILDLNSIVFDDYTKEALEGATVTLIDGITSDTIKSLINVDGNDFYFKVRKDREYTIQVTRPFYNSQTIGLSTVGITESTKIDKKIYLKTDRMQLVIETFNKRTKDELTGVEVTMKNLTNGDVDTVAVNDTGNKFHFYTELGSKYEIQASKFGFVTEIDIVDLIDVTEPILINHKLYLEVFDIEDYMPVIVYFENDQPNPNSKSTSTDAIYGDLFKSYMNEKLDYIKNNTKNKKNNDKALAQKNLDAFFEGDVVGGYDKLKRFMRALKKELELGRSLEIAIKGYTSPLADSRYNLAVGQRRVSSVKNELLQYENGYFRRFVEEGKLIITDISFGEETSPADVSDKINDKSESKYGLGASKERRVQIVKITDQ